MMALRCLLGRTLKPSLGFCVGGSVTARNCSLKAGDRLREWDFRSTFNPGSPVFEDFPSLIDFADRKPIAAPQGMDPEYFRRSFVGGIACAGPVTDPTVVEPACSAVQQYNVQQNAKLEFVRVLRGYVEVGLPTKFILILEAIDAGLKKKCRAEILQDASNNYDMVLQSFEVVSGSPET